MTRHDTTQALVVLATTDLTGDIGFFGRDLGMRMDMIYPADDPSVAVFSGHGLRVRLEKSNDPPGHIVLATDKGLLDDAGAKVSPGGTRVTFTALNPPIVLPSTQHSFVVRRLADQAPWVIGRAGMHYRDLIPDRLGGSIIASHIRIPDGGPVPDMVHFHRVGFQLIFCYRGWVDVVYEDQGAPIRLQAGDCFIQPPEIRHRVLEASDGIEVIEIGVPAEHITEIDHDMVLPTPELRPDRTWSGQKFVYNKGSDGAWDAHAFPGFEARDTTISANTQDVAGVQVLRRSGGEPQWMQHDADIYFCFVMEGTMTLQAKGKEPFALRAGDAFVTPPDLPVCYFDPSDDIALLEVTLPGKFAARPERESK